ncbi:MAG: alpha/beta hydrolase [Actinomycetota bacterium]|nr:alpha/beta hydrolase [Actinomycetota bacterium]
MLTKWYVNRKIEELDKEMDELFSDCKKGFVKSFDGTRIGYRTVGKGLPIVVSSGVFTSYMFFHSFKDYFSSAHQVLFWDYRGHPTSDVPSDLDSISIETCAKDLKAVMDHLGIEKAIHVGFSMGVMTIIEAYRQYPDRILGLVPINGPYSNAFAFVTQLKKAQELIVRLLDFTSRHSYVVEWAKPLFVFPINAPIAKRVELNPTLFPELEMELYFDYIAKIDWKAGIKTLAAMGRYDGEDVLETIEVPTLIISGERDGWTPRGIADEMHRRIGGSEFAMIPGGSHATPAENPEMLNYRIDIFLREHFGDLGKKTTLSGSKARKRVKT